MKRRGIFITSILFIFLLFMFITFGCGGGGDDGDGQNAQNATSSICANVTGTEAIAWDFANGLIRTDESVLPPPVPFFTGGNSFLHPSFPVLSFIYPEGWNPTTIDGGIHNVGVNLIRNDTQAIWREQQASLQGVSPVRDVRNAEINALLQLFALYDAQVQTVCENEGTIPVGGGINMEFSNIMIRAGDHTAMILASVVPLPGLPTASVKVKVVGAPTAEFPTLAIDTFMAIEWQMLFRTTDLPDRDLDGVPDLNDRYPDDRTKY